MWGSWYGVVTAVLVGGLLLLAAALTAWTPLFAFGIAAVAIGGFALYYGVKGGREEVARDEDRPHAPADEPEHQPRSAGEGAAGIWGEKREA
jgi:phage tail tape-measure protein